MLKNPLIALLILMSSTLWASIDPFHLSQRLGFDKEISYDFIVADKSKHIPAEKTSIQINFDSQNISPFLLNLNTINTERTKIALGKCSANSAAKIYRLFLPIKIGKRFQLKNHKLQGYEISLKVKCQHNNIFVFKNNSFAGKALKLLLKTKKVDDYIMGSLKLKILQYRKLFKSPIGIVYPGGGNFYDFKNVYIDRVDHWDVVGHEIAHAIYDRLELGVTDVGEHYIDRCYSQSLALSEGWPSYFAALVWLKTNNPKPLLPYMVKRRGPMNIETVPQDVCAGYTNEWRVVSYLWDITDQTPHEDGIHMDSEMFFKSLINQNHQGLQSIHNSLKQSLNVKELESVWQSNL